MRPAMAVTEPEMVPCWYPTVTLLYRRGHTVRVAMFQERVTNFLDVRMFTPCSGVSTEHPMSSPLGEEVRIRISSVLSFEFVVYGIMFIQHPTV